MGPNYPSSGSVPFKYSAASGRAEVITILNDSLVLVEGQA